MLKPGERAQALLKESSRDFQSRPPFERSCDNHWKFSILLVFSKRF